MLAETKHCQNCQQLFVIEPDDFAFYEKIKVPPPTFCFDCRVQRRLAFRNERGLHKRKCDAPNHGEDMISMFAQDNPQRVYCHRAWWGNDWDAKNYGRDVDFSKPFLTQLKDLWREVPDVALLNINPVNSEYCNVTEGNKNCYLVFGGDFNEHTFYSNYIFNSKECLDTYLVDKSERCYELIDCLSCTRLSYSRYCEGCYDSAFLLNCTNCHDCFGCVNLKNKSYCIFNEQYTKEGYQEKIKEFDISRRSGVEEMRKKFYEFSLKFPRRFAKMIRATNSTGDNLEETKNCIHCFDMLSGAEDCRHTYLSYSKTSNCSDVDRTGMNTELGYDSSTIYPGSRVFFSRFTFSSHDIWYSYNSHNSSYLFGCVGMRNAQYCILNKQYDKDSFEKLKTQIIAQMEQDKTYGEFFPMAMSPFPYNESVAQEVFPRPIEHEEKTYIPTIRFQNIPDAIADTTEGVLKEIIECEHQGTCIEQCSKAFKITPAELGLYRNQNIPLPSMCSNCRHYRRLSQRNPMKLWHRSCQCTGKAQNQNDKYQNTAEHSHGDQPCSNEFETSYAPERPEIIYCEGCYQAEIS